MAVPKVFQTFNSLLGSIVRKRNATIVGPSKQLVGEFPSVTFERLYEYYHGWDQIKRAVDTMHQKFMGAGIEVNSNNEAFNVFVKKWWDIANAEKKFSEFFFSVFITGNGILEVQYTPDGRLGNIEHIPMQTIFRIFRDQFGNELKLVQVVDGVFKELDPEFFIHWLINNPDRQAFGKSEFHSLASPRPVTAKVDGVTGEAINPDRTLRPLLDAQAILQNSEVEIKEKMAKPRLLVSAVGMPRDQMAKVQSEMANADSDQYIWLFDKPIDSKELQVQGSPKFDQYGQNVEDHIDIGTGFASKVIKNSGSFSYSSSQTPFDVLDQRMVDMQSQASEMIKDRLIRPLAESWGFKDFDEMEIEVSFMPSVRRLSMDDIRQLPTDAVSPEEKREILKKLHIPLDDNLWEDFQKEAKKAQREQLDANIQSGAMGGGSFGGGSFGGGNGEDGGFPEESGFPDDGAGHLGNAQGQSPTSPTSGSSDESPKTRSPPVKDPFEKTRPDPTRKDKKSGESIKETELLDTLKKLASEVEGLKKQVGERIPLPPTAYNDSQDMYVSQGIHQQGLPEITDPEIRKEYGLDKDEFEDELPASAPQRQADPSIGVNPDLDPDGTDQQIKDAKRGSSVDTGNAYDGGTNIDGGGIDDQSDGAYKDPYDLDNAYDPQLEKPLSDMKNIGPRQPPTVKEEEYKKELANEKDVEKDIKKNLEKQPIAPAELDPREYDKTKGQDIQNIEPEMNEPLEEEDERLEKEDNDPEIPKTDPTGQDNEERVEINNGSFREEETEVPTNDEQPLDLQNDDQMNQTDTPAGAISGLDDAIIGDSSQYRMKKDELGLNEPEEEPYKEILDNTGLNMKPDGAVNDGMVVMPSDRQQVDPNAPFDPSENEVEYTDQTDEQGNLIPDLRFDQTPNSDEDQPEIEREHEIVTQEDFEKEEELADIDGMNQMEQVPEELGGEEPEREGIGLLTDGRPEDEGEFMNFDSIDDLKKYSDSQGGANPEVETEEEIPDKEFPTEEFDKKEAEEEVSGPPAGTTIHANSLDKEREEPDVLPDGKVVEPLKWKTKKGENKKTKKRSKKSKKRK